MSQIKDKISQIDTNRKSGRGMVAGRRVAVKMLVSNSAMNIVKLIYNS